MEFSLDKCANATFNRGKLSTRGIQLIDKSGIQEPEPEATYIHLGTEDGTENQKIKARIHNTKEVSC